MNKIKSYFKEHWFILLIILFSLVRFILTFNLKSFYLENLLYDDGLMIRNYSFLKMGKYLGANYFKTTLVKGPLFSILMFVISLYKVNYASIFTVLYILVSLFVMFSLKDIIKNKKYLLLIYVVLLFNPATYSQDLFQRLYRNSITITEFLFFFGVVIRVLFNDKNKILNYSLLGLSLSFMFLTREDNLWVYPILLFIVLYTFIKNKSIKTILINSIPFIILIGILNLVSLVNYKHYGIYTYNEIQKSEFHNTYKKILQIKDKEKIDNVAIPRSTLYMLADNAKSFNFTKEEIDDYYKQLKLEDEEIYNGNIIWYLRDIIYCHNKFMSGKESEKYYKKLGKEIDKLFLNGTFKKEFIMPSVFMDVPTKEDIYKIPKNLLYAVWYTASYKDIKTLTDTSEYEFDRKSNSYHFVYKDYHNTINIVKHNSLRFEIIRIIYKYITIIFGIISIIIYFKNIIKFDNISVISHILMVIYILIIGGVVYTHTTSFHAIRPLYLGILYIVQTLFILINMYRLYEKKQGLKK